LNLRNKRHLQHLSLYSMIALLTVFASLCPAQETQSSLGELKLEGKHIEYMELRRKDGYIEKINLPAETIQLPVGEYRLQQVKLKGLYSAGMSTRISGVDMIKISEKLPAVLKVGAPLCQKIEVERSGAILELDYKLIGIGGECYTNSDTRKKPGFTIYKGDRLIDSGKFEYG
jgi:hypothetical protein